MREEPTTHVIQRYLDALPHDAAAEPIVRELLDRAVRQLHTLSAAMLYRKYPRLTQPPLNGRITERLSGLRRARISTSMTRLMAP
jgi:hypothetical protein